MTRISMTSAALTMTLSLGAQSPAIAVQPLSTDAQAVFEVLTGVKLHG